MDTNTEPTSQPMPKQSQENLVAVLQFLVVEPGIDLEWL